MTVDLAYALRLDSPTLGWSPSWARRQMSRTAYRSSRRSFVHSETGASNIDDGLRTTPVAIADCVWTRPGWLQIPEVRIEFVDGRGIEIGDGIGDENGIGSEIRDD